MQYKILNWSINDEQQYSVSTFPIPSILFKLLLNNSLILKEKNKQVKIQTHKLRAHSNLIYWHFCDFSNPGNTFHRKCIRCRQERHDKGQNYKKQARKRMDDPIFIFLYKQIRFIDDDANNFNDLQLIVIRGSKLAEMKHRVSSLPNQQTNIHLNRFKYLSKQKETHAVLKTPQKQPIQLNNNLLKKNQIIKSGQRDHNKILVRKNRAKFQKSSQLTQKNMRKTMNYLSTRYQVYEVNRSSNMTLPQSQKQKFMGILQSKILNKQFEDDEKGKAQEFSKEQIENKIDQRINSYFQSKTYRISMPNNKINQSLQQNRISASYSIDKRSFLRSHRTEKIQDHMMTGRSRSRTIARENIQIKLTLANKSSKDEVSRTIELPQEQERSKIDKSLSQLEKYQKHSISKDIKGIQKELMKKTSDKQDLQPIDQIHKKQSISNLQLSSLNIKNTQDYQKEVNSLTKDFFHEWERMNMNKSKIYKNLRKKLVTIFPGFKRYYKQFKESDQVLQLTHLKDAQKNVNKEQIIIQATDLNSNLKGSQLKLRQSLSSGYNPTQIKDFQQKMQQLHQKQQLKDIFKQAYFWSRTKKKSMSNNFLVQQQADKKEMIQIKKIQKNLTFINYMKSKTNKSDILHSKYLTKGTNIIKNKETILEIQKQGTKQQQFLKKCLDNAIQNCIRAHQ